MSLVVGNQNIHLIPQSHIVEIYKCLDPLSALVFSKVNQRMRTIFINNISTLMRSHFWYAVDSSMRHYPQEHYLAEYLRQATTMSKNACPAIVWRKQAVPGVRRITCIEISPDGKMCVSLSLDGVIKLWDLSTGEVLTALETGGEGFACTHMSRDGRTLLLGLASGTIQLWDLKERRTLQTLHLRSYVQSVHMDVKGKRAIIGLHEGDMVLWDLAEGRVLHDLPNRLPARSLKYVQISADGEVALLGFLKGTLELWNVSTGEFIDAIEAGVKDGKNAVGPHYLSSLALRADGGAALVGFGKGLEGGIENGKVQLWDLKSKQLLHTMDGHEHEVNYVQMDKEGKVAVSGSSEAIKFWHTKTGKCFRTLQTGGIGRKFRLYPDGTKVVVGSADGMLELIHLTPDPQERVMAVVNAFLKEDGQKYFDFVKLPNFVRTEMVINSGGLISVALSPSIYVSRKFLPEIAELFKRAVIKKPPVEEGLSENILSRISLFLSSKRAHALSLTRKSRPGRIHAPSILFLEKEQREKVAASLLSKRAFSKVAHKRFDNLPECFQEAVCEELRSICAEKGMMALKRPLVFREMEATDLERAQAMESVSGRKLLIRRGKLEQDE